MFKELNSKRTIREGIDLQELNFVKLKELEGRNIKVDGYFFTRGDYGEQVVVVGEGMKINMPARAVAQFKEIDVDPIKVKAVLDGHLMITDIAESKTRKGITTNYTLDDC